MASLAGAFMESAFLNAFISLIKGCEMASTQNNDTAISKMYLNKCFISFILNKNTVDIGVIFSKFLGC